ncbi:MAG: lipopolysaccharide kinase InaA family protein [bacterium]
MIYTRPSFRIDAPQAPKHVNEHVSARRPLKIIGRTGQGLSVLVDDSAVRGETTNIIMNGYLLDLEAIERGAVAQIEPVKVKVALTDDMQLAMAQERDLLAEISGTSGFPELVTSGTFAGWEPVQYQPTETRIEQASYFVMRVLPGQDLALYTLPWKDSAPPRSKLSLLTGKAFPQLPRLTAQLHAKGIVHRDVKPNNALFDDQTVSLLDLGRANRLAAEPRKDIGTYGYFPPEAMVEGPSAEDVRYDTYGVGAAIFSVLTGQRILYNGMPDIWNMGGMDFMFVSPRTRMQEYCQLMGAMGHRTPAELLKELNMPGEIKETSLAKYLAELIHPAKEQRPVNHAEIADKLQLFGAELETLEIWT